MSRFLQLIKGRTVVLDGAMGTMLYQQGIFVSQCYEESVLRQPGIVLDIHKKYVKAGADVILTNTFGANEIKLGGFGIAGDTEKLNAAAVALAREAVAGSDALVAGDVGPTGERGARVKDMARAEAALRRQISALADAKVDLIFLETFSSLDELLMAAKLARETGLPVHASFAAKADGKTATGEAMGDILAALDGSPDVDTVGLNCTLGPREMFDLAAGLGRFPSKPLLVKPNVGDARDVGGRMMNMSTPEFFAEYAKRLVQIGVRGVGGCCGTTPEHIVDTARALKPAGMRVSAAVVELTSAQRAESPAAPLRERSAFGRKLSEGRKVTSIEVMPPAKPDTSDFIEKARRCRDAGVDAINIPDGPRAMARVSPLVSAILVRQSVPGIEPIPHYCCRDRNLLGIQSDAMAAAAVGIRNILSITGDTPKPGGGPEIAGVFNTDAIGLAAVLDGMNHGIDICGKPLAPKSSFVIGVGLNPFAVNHTLEIERFIRKIDAGADYAITQPVYDADSLLRFLDKIEARPGYRRIPIIAGIYPLVSLRNAQFMRTEVSGVLIPDSIVERLAKFSDKEDSMKEGVDISREMIEKIADRVAGFEASAPFGKIDMALEVLEGRIVKEGDAP